MNLLTRDKPPQGEKRNKYRSKHDYWIAPAERTSQPKTTKKTAAKVTGPKSKTAAKKSKPKGATKKAKPAKQPKSAHVTKTTTLLELLRRKEGATIADIAKETGWQNHSIRGFISGIVTKQMGLTVESSKNDAGERAYRIG
jgi:hypothetical protein